ncbi:MAG: universal stress protein [Firmicutes bacterium]|nr:universal stress protein [Bacillota bacterium]MCL5040474.1 universal stress protein [Bacillota bacterium]
MFGKILAPVDGSEMALGAAKLALELARTHGSEVTFLYVVGVDILLTDQSTYGQFIDYVGLEKVLREGGEKILSETLALAQSMGIAARTVMLEGHVASEILRLAEEDKYDLIAMATHGRGGLKRLVLGSVAEAVTRQATCPVLLVRSPGDQ